MAQSSFEITNVAPFDLLGAEDKLAKKLEREFPGLKIQNRGNSYMLDGSAEQISAAERILRELADLIAQGIKDEEWLKGYLAKKPAIVAASSVVTAASNAPEAAAASALTEEQKNIIKASGLSVDDFIQARAKLPA